MKVRNIVGAALFLAALSWLAWLRGGDPASQVSGPAMGSRTSTLFVCVSDTHGLHNHPGKLPVPAGK